MAYLLPRVLGAALVSCLAASPLCAQVWIPPQEPCEPDTRGPTRDAERRLGDAAEADDPDERARRLEEAADKLGDAFDRGGSPGAWYYLGRYYVLTEDPVGADSAMQQATELIPSAPRTSNDTWPKSRRSHWARAPQRGWGAIVPGLSNTCGSRRS